MGGTGRIHAQGKCLIFARTPELGKVKTRLQPALGVEGCLDLHQQLVQITIENAVSAQIAPVEIWHTGDADHSFWQQQASSYPLSFTEQPSGDLGERLSQAFAQSLSSGEGSELRAEYLQQAVRALERGEQCVIGPAEDGGYVLIGLRTPKPFLFEDISWGGDKVLKQTLEAAAQADCSVHLLNPLRDIDIAEDLDHFVDQLTFVHIGNKK